MTALKLEPTEGSAPRAVKSVTVPLDSQAFERDALGAAAGKFLADDLNVNVSVPDGEAVAAKVEAVARKVEVFLRANPSSTWRFSTVDPDDDDFAALLEPEEVARVKAYTINKMASAPEFWPNFGLPQDEFDRIALRHSRAVASEASSRATGYRRLVISPKPSRGSGWTRMRLRVGASTDDVEAFEKAAAAELLIGRSVDAWLPTCLPRGDIMAACHEIECAARAMKKKRREARVKAAALQIVEAKLRNPLGDDSS